MTRTRTARATRPDGRCLSFNEVERIIAVAEYFGEALLSVRPSDSDPMLYFCRVIAKDCVRHVRVRVHTALFNLVTMVTRADP